MSTLIYIRLQDFIVKIVFIYLFFVAFSLSAFAEVSQEVEIKGDSEVNLIVSKAIGKKLPEGTGCEALPPKNRCEARLMCYSQARIFNNNSSSKKEAILEAKEDAEFAYVEFVESAKKDRTKNCIKKVGKLMENNKSKERISSLCSTISSSSSSGIVRGLETIVTRIDMQQKEVTVVIGRRCEGQNVINEIKKQDRKLGSDDDEWVDIDTPAIDEQGIKSKTYELDDF